MKVVSHKFNQNAVVRYRQTVYIGRKHAQSGVKNVGQGNAIPDKKSEYRIARQAKM